MFFNLVKGQPAGACLVRDAKLRIPYISDISHYNIHQRGAQTLRAPERYLEGL